MNCACDLAALPPPHEPDAVAGEAGNCGRSHPAEAAYAEASPAASGAATRCKRGDSSQLGNEYRTATTSLHARHHPLPGLQSLATANTGRLGRSARKLPHSPWGLTEGTGGAIGGGPVHISEVGARRARTYRTVQSARVALPQYR